MSETPERHETTYSEHADEIETAPQPPAPDNADPNAPTRAETAYSQAPAPMEGETPPA